VKSGVFPGEMGGELRRAFSKRQLGDYECTFVVSRADSEQLIEAGRKFVATAVAYLTRNGLL
jgi:uncharacterized protein (UPF0332 family)